MKISVLIAQCDGNCLLYILLPKLYILNITIYGRRTGAMAKLKIVEIVLLAASALITAAKAIIKFIGYLIKLKKETTEYACA